MLIKFEALIINIIAMNDLNGFKTNPQNDSNHRNRNETKPKVDEM